MMGTRLAYGLKRTASLFSRLGFRRFQGAKSIYRRVLTRILPTLVQCRVGPISFQMRTNEPGCAVDMMTGDYEPVTTAAFLRAVRPGMRIVDVGAHVGYYSILASRAAGAEGSVLAIEPDPESLALLQQNLDWNGCKNVRVVQAGVADRAGPATLYVDPLGPGYNSLYPLSHTTARPISVRLETLDALVEGQADLVKMDIEGAEPRALQGMTRLLRDSPDLVLFVEVNPERLRAAGTSATETARLLVGQGFELWALDDVRKECWPVTSPDDPALEDLAWATLVGVRGVRARERVAAIASKA